MTYSDVINEAKDSTYLVVDELKQLLSPPGEAAECSDADSGAITISRKKLKELLVAAKAGNKGLTKVHRYTQAELNRSNFEKAILKKEAIKDTVDREACFTHTLSVIQELEGMGTTVNQGSKISTQINHMLGGMTSPPCLHFFDASLATYVQEHDLLNYAKMPSGPAFEEFLYQFSGAYLDSTIAPGSLAGSVLFVPQHATEPEKRVDPMGFVLKDTRSQQTIDASFVDFMNYAARRTLEEEVHNAPIDTERRELLSRMASASGEGVHIPAPQEMQVDT